MVDPVLLARIQFGANITFHILFPAISIALGWVLFYFRLRANRTGEQRWLDAYGLEVYLLWKTLVLGYRHTEVPCTKIYPPKKLGWTKMKPITGWWNILRPIFLLGLGLRR